MKHINQQFNAIIETDVQRVKDGEPIIKGEVVPHKEVVKFVRLFTPTIERGEITDWTEIKVFRNQLESILKQIEGIEKRVFDQPTQTELPF